MGMPSWDLTWINTPGMHGDVFLVALYGLPSAIGLLAVVLWLLLITNRRSRRDAEAAERWHARRG